MHRAVLFKYWFMAEVISKQQEWAAPQRLWARKWGKNQGRQRQYPYQQEAQSQNTEARKAEQAQWQ